MDARAFTEQYRTIYQDLYRFALYTMRNPHDAEDAVSEAVLAGYTGMEGLRKDEAFKSWMFTITANVCRKKLRLKGTDLEVVAVSALSLFYATHFSYPPSFGSIHHWSLYGETRSKRGICIPCGARCTYRHD